MICRSVEVELRTPGELRCFSRRKPFQGNEALDRTTLVGPGAIARRGESEYRDTSGWDSLILPEAAEVSASSNSEFIALLSIREFGLICALTVTGGNLGRHYMFL